MRWGRVRRPQRRPGRREERRAGTSGSSPAAILLVPVLASGHHRPHHGFDECGGPARWWYREGLPHLDRHT
ncbi:hypothetical protein B005_4918 [Nocardiopsis alba ATCC BAA-2165]|uniref:Uncharacterized protein n=1 Tax=Nocardiopsis alba (strain ATCC BAA-2165 / BE74) TaxID=1205910 RepID=J7KXL1_NOCAA|nr:hypothetical protein B005_4918 [Nocardiopsis alba ATCC BAA-2165]